MKLNSLVVAASLLMTAGGAALAQGQAQPPVESASESDETEPSTFEEVAARLFAGKKTETLTPAVTPLVVQPFDDRQAAALSSGGGIVSDAPILAEQPLRPLDAIVVVVDNRRRVLPLTVIGKIEIGANDKASFPDDPARRAWCNWRDQDGEGLSCFVDKDGDGRLETRRRAHSKAERSAIAIDHVFGEEPMDPLGYAAAPEEDYPTFALQYRRCESGNDKIVYRVRVGIPTRSDLDGACTNLAEPLNGVAQGEAGYYRIDRVVVRKMGPEADAEFRLIEAIPTGTVLDRIDGDQAVVDIGTRKAWWQEKIKERAALSKPPYVLTGGPTIVTAEGDEGDIMFIGSLGYSYTGRVANDAISKALFSRGAIDLREGQFVYGLPMRASNPRGRPQSEPSMYWCAPIETSEGKWRASCLGGGEVLSSINENVTPAFMTRHIYGRGFGIESVTVDVGPVSFDTPIEVRYEFRGWDDDKLMIGVRSGPGTGHRDSFRIDIPRPEGRPALVRLGGGLYEVTPVPGDEDGYRVAMKEPPRPGGSAIPAIDLQLPTELRNLLENATD